MEGEEYTESAAVIVYDEEENDFGRLADCVYARCDESGDTAGPVWGHGERSVKRALATLSEECSCEARYHFDVEGR
jgi:hypothetical protein